MILAGIDEAGYGPLIGPLIVGCCAFEIEGDPLAAELPCIWNNLRKLVSKKRCAKGKRIHVNDSKAVYSPSAGLKELEKAILSIFASANHWPVSFDDFVNHVSGHCIEEMNRRAWYRGDADEIFPFSCDGTSMKLFSNGLRAECLRTNTRCVHLSARVLFEKPLNEMLTVTHNKASVLFSTAAIHLDELIRKFSKQGLTIFCDRQGGREHYGSLLRLMFEDWHLEIVSEIQGDCEYRLSRSGEIVRILFKEKAEAQCLPVAAASMLSKYLREVFMHRLNKFWQQHLPELTPTAGYYTDGVRFLQDIQVKRYELGVPDAEIIRSR
jgi:ribonuclease HII